MKPRQRIGFAGDVRIFCRELVSRPLQKQTYRQWLANTTKRTTRKILTVVVERANIGTENNKRIRSLLSSLLKRRPMQEWGDLNAPRRIILLPEEKRLALEIGEDKLVKLAIELNNTVRGALQTSYTMKGYKESYSPEKVVDLSLHEANVLISTAIDALSKK
ncbi:MAG TPA: hypothetical protein VJH23_05995 [archaeon]|nr:hypothetical protein [archaeon]